MGPAVAIFRCYSYARSTTCELCFVTARPNWSLVGINPAVPEHPKSPKQWPRTSLLVKQGHYVRYFGACIYVYIYIYIYMYMYMYMYRYTLYIYIHAYIHICIHLYTFLCICIYIRSCKIATSSTVGKVLPGVNSYNLDFQTARLCPPPTTS